MPCFLGAGNFISQTAEMWPYKCVIIHTHPFNGPLSRTTRVSRYQKGKPIWILQKQETVSGSGISWAICKSAPRSRQITMPALHHSVFYKLDAIPAAQPTSSKHWRQKMCYKVIHNQISVLNDDFLVFSDRTSTRRHCYKLYKGYSQVNTHKYFFTNRICDIWNALPSSVVEASSLTVGPCWPN